MMIFHKNSASRFLGSLGRRAALAALSAICLAILLAPTASAAGVPINPVLRPGGSAQLVEEGTAPQDVPEATRLAVVNKVVDFVLAFAGIVAIFYILNNSWYLIVAAGSEEKVTQHKKGIMWALIGLLLIILAYSAVRFIIWFVFSVDQTPVEAP